MCHFPLHCTATRHSSVQGLPANGQHTQNWCCIGGSFCSPVQWHNKHIFLPSTFTTAWPHWYHVTNGEMIFYDNSFRKKNVIPSSQTSNFCPGHIHLDIVSLVIVCVCCVFLIGTEISHTIYTISNTGDVYQLSGEHHWFLVFTVSLDNFLLLNSPANMFT